MLKALKMWRDRAPHDTPPPGTSTSARAGAGRGTAPGSAQGRGADDARGAADARPAAGAGDDQALPLLEVGPSKEAFLRAVCEAINRCGAADDLLADVEAYLRRHAGPELMVRWGWESIEAATPTGDGGESLQALIARSMIEAGVRLVTLVLEGHVATNRARPLIERLWQAEWSVRRADQTLFLDEDELLAARRPPDGLYLDQPGDA